MTDETGSNTDETNMNPPVSDEISPERQARIDHMQPLLDVVQGDGFNQLWTALNALKTQYMEETIGFPHLFGVIDIMPRLKEWAESQ